MGTENKIHEEAEHQLKLQNQKDAFKILENENKELRLELENKNNEIQQLQNELNKKKNFSCEYVFHTYAVYKGTDNIAICECRKDYMSRLPNELMVKIFHYLPQRFLHVCAKVCKRWRSIYHHKSLWRKVKISNQGICINEIDCIIALGVQKLILYEVFSLEELNLTEDEDEESSDKSKSSTVTQHQQDNHNELQKLKLDFVGIKKSVLCNLIRQSSALTSLSLDRLNINTKVCKAISTLKNLISLKLICLNLFSKDLECILQGCTNLTKLDLTRSQNWLSELPSYFPPQLTKLVLTEVFYGRGSNEQFKGVIQKCPNLVWLNIDYCLGLSQISVNFISMFLQKLQYLSLKGNDRLNYNLSILKNIPTLQEIRLSCERDDVDPTLKENLKNIKLTIIYNTYNDIDSDDCCS